MAPRRGFLAAALATAMSVLPSLAPAQERPVVKPVANAKIGGPEDKPVLLSRAVDYSKDNPVVVIIVSKGQKDPISGEKICETLTRVLDEGYNGVPSKCFTEPGGTYSAIGFAVAGHLYGPYGLKDSLVAIAVPADNYHSKVRRGIFPPRETSSASTPAGGFAAKPEPGQ